MFSLNSISIKLTSTPNGSNRAYLPNQIISGHVAVVVCKTIKRVRGLKLTLIGEASGSGSEHKRSGDRYHRVNVKEKFVNSVQYLFGSANGDYSELKKDIYKYEFSYRLPSFIPYSIERSSGYVRYSLKANLDIFLFPDLFAVLEFPVARHEDLNDFPELKLPLVIEESQFFSSVFSSSKPVEIKFSLHKRGFACGEAIPISITVNNKTSINIACTIIELERFFQFGENGEKAACETIIKVKNEGVTARQRKIINEIVRVPCDAFPSNDKYCRVFQVKYELVLKLKTYDWYKLPPLRVPIVIGKVELISDESADQPAPSAPPEIQVPQYGQYDAPPPYSVDVAEGHFSF